MFVSICSISVFASFVCGTTAVYEQVGGGRKSRGGGMMTWEKDGRKGLVGRRMGRRGRGGSKR